MLPSAASAIERKQSGPEDDAVGGHLHDSQLSPTTTSNPWRYQNESPEPYNSPIPTKSAADALENSDPEPRNRDEPQMSQILTALLKELSAFREGEEKRTARLEEAITGLRPSEIQVDPRTNFWTAYKKVADEHDDALVSRYVGDMDTSLIFAGLFSAVTTAFIVQNIQTLQSSGTHACTPQQDGTSPAITPNLCKAQSVLFASLSITLLAALIAVLGKQWILYYSKVSILGNVIDRGKEHHVKLRGLQKWGLRFVVEFIPVLLQFALLLFGVALIIYLWDLDMPAALVVLVITSIGCTFYACIAMAATVRDDCPFQTPFSILVPMFWSRVKESGVHVRGWLRRRLKRWGCSILPRTEQAPEHHRLMGPVGRLRKILFNGKVVPGHVIEDVQETHNLPELSNPAFWRREPLFPPIPKDTDITVSAGVWLLENSTDYSVATAVAGIFSEFQWPLLDRPTTALIGLRGAYMECFRAPRFDSSTRLKALQYAATYYVLYHAQLVWNASKSREVEVEKLPPNLPPDLFVYKHGEKWGDDDLFEYLLRVDDRSEPVTSARFLSYIAPYWFCGDSGPAVGFRSSRLQTLRDLVAALESSHALVPTTLTNCVLCVGAAMDFPLHPEDLFRVDKSRYFAPTFRAVVEHIHGIVLAASHRRRHIKTAMDILHTIAKQTPLPLFDSAWINELLERSAEVDMADEQFILFLRLSARRTEEDPTLGAGAEDYLIPRLETDPQSLGRTVTSETPTPAPDHTLFSKIMKNIQACVNGGGDWQDDVVYGGLVAITRIRLLEPSHFDDDDLQLLHDAMDSNKLLRVRKAAYDVMLVTRDQWLKSVRLRQKLKDLHFFRGMRSVVAQVARGECDRSFLMIIEVLSEDEYWRSYLREAMDIWLSLRHEGPEQVLSILANVGNLLRPWRGDYNPHALDESLQKIVEEEWAAVPGRPVHDLTVDRLKPLVEVTEQFKELLFDEDSRREVLARVRGVVPLLEGQRQGVRGIIDDLLLKLQIPPSQTPRRRSTLWYHS